MTAFTPGRSALFRAEKIQQRLCIMILAIGLCACTATIPLPEYIASDDTQIHNQPIDLNGVELGSFISDFEVHPICRGGWARITPGGEKDFEHYIRHAVADELGLAAKNTHNPSRVKLTGHVEQLEFSSTVDWLSSGYWHVRLRLDSSNGHTLTVDQKRSFETGYHDVPACEKVAAQFPVIVRTLIESLVANPGFPSLLE